MNTQQIETALNLLNDLYGNNPTYISLSQESKLRLALAVLRAFKK